MVDRPEDDEDGRHAHHHMEVGDHEHGVRKRNVHDDVAEEQAGDAAVHECEDEGDGKQHRQREVDVAPPQRQHPVVDLDGGRHRDDERGGGEEDSRNTGFIPLTYMWCAHTTKLRAPMATIAHTIIR